MITRRHLIAGLIGGVAAGATRSSAIPLQLTNDSSVVRLAFGSCVSQRKNQDIWQRILDKEPHLFIMMGDGVYPEHEPGALPMLQALRSAYRHARTRPEFQRFREQVRTIAIWDDNDYGGSDIGRTFEDKTRSRDLFLEHWASAREASIRRRDTGIYAYWELGEPDRRIQIIVPDLRFCRSEWAQTEGDLRAARSEIGLGPYKPIVAEEVTMLGEEQWGWLGECLRRPARLRLFVSSIQLVPEDRGWESWSNFPTEKQRLLDLFETTGPAPIVVLSGDTHYAEFSRQRFKSNSSYLWEFTSSGLTETWPTPGPNAQRVGLAHSVANFGLLTMDWAASRPAVTVELFAEDGSRLGQQSVFLESLAGSA